MRLRARRAAEAIHRSIDRHPESEGTVEDDDMDESHRIGHGRRPRRTCAGYIRGHGAVGGVGEEGEEGCHLGKG